jgi:Tfp pilus assembly protein PilV
MRHRPSSRPRPHNDSGETLIELLVTVVIMATAVVAVVGATATSIHLTDVHRKQAKAGSYVRAYAEAVESAVARTPTGYVACAAPAAYMGNSIYPTPETGYVPSATAVKVWSGSVWASSGAGCTDIGVQRVTLQVALTGQVTETLDIVIRRPCRPSDTTDASCN